MSGHEYRVTWQRKGQAKKRALYQTRKGAETCAARQVTAADDMDWLPVRLRDLVSAPVIEERAVGTWVAA